MRKFSPLTAAKPGPFMLTSPGQGPLPCKGCSAISTRFVLGPARPRARRDAARVAGFNFVKGRGWLCLDCEFEPVTAPTPAPTPAPAP